MRILITGSSGFIGRHLWQVLTEQGHFLTGVDLRNFQSRPVDALDFFREDTTKYDLAFHCAAIVGGRVNIDGSPLSVGTNLALDAWYFRWLQKSHTPQAVYFSSSAAYPIGLQSSRFKRCLREDDINLDVMCKPDQTYGFSKLAGELLAKSAEAEGVKVTIVRPFSGYSESQSLHYPFPKFVDRALSREDPFCIWGDGTQVRDWVHVDDVINGTLAAVENDVQGPVNLCTGQATSFNELAQLVCSEAGYSPVIEHLSHMPVGVHYRVGSAEKLNSFYTPKVSLSEGISRAILCSAQ